METKESMMKQLRKLKARIKEESEVYAMTFIVIIAAVVISLIQQTL